jgi:hypothetical protein
MMDSGKTAKRMDSASRCGRMVHIMKVDGGKEKSAARESLSIQMETSMRANGKTTLQMVKGYSFTLMGKNTSASGRTTISTDMVLRHGLMVPTMRDNIVMALRTGLEN